jgi:GNAT superfamily N-acetyltransferase
MIFVRTAEQQDAEAIARVHVASWRSTYKGIVPEAYLAGLDEGERVQQWRQWLTLPVRVYVAELDGEVVGFVSGGALREPLAGCDGELFAIYLLERVQGQGIGTALLRRLAEGLRADGFQGMAVWVLERNPAVGFYEAAGAERVTGKEIEIGGAVLRETGLVWRDLGRILRV